MLKKISLLLAVCLSLFMTNPASAQQGGNLQLYYGAVGLFHVDPAFDYFLFRWHVPAGPLYRITFYVVEYRHIEIVDPWGNVVVFNEPYLFQLGEPVNINSTNNIGEAQRYPPNHRECYAPVAKLEVWDGTKYVTVKEWWNWHVCHDSPYSGDTTHLLFY